MEGAWTWAGARVRGTAHLKSGLPCQDFVGCTELNTQIGAVLLAVVSDGAGSASHAEAGARMVCFGFLRVATDYLRSHRKIAEVDCETAMTWLDAIRDRIGVYARAREITPRDCAATLVGVVVGPESSVVVHVGDGAAVVREQSTGNWLVPSWPYHGEYASSTAFVTDDPAAAPTIVHLPTRLDRVAVFSDGIERLVLDHTNRAPHVPFFERRSAPVRGSSVAGHDRAISAALRAYLGGQSVCDRTDDDTSLIIGVR